jgi:Flp pilus assembly protein CpaB
VIVGLVILIVVALIAVVVGVAFGKVVAAPAIQRVADRTERDEESGDQPG